MKRLPYHPFSADVNTSSITKQTIVQLNVTIPYLTSSALATHHLSHPKTTPPPYTMRPNILLALLSSTSIATATTFTAFPTTLTCNLASGTATFTTSELESIASAGVKETPFEKSASNTGSGRCQKINLPYYSVSALLNNLN